MSPALSATTGSSAASAGQTAAAAATASGEGGTSFAQWLQAGESAAAADAAAPGAAVETSPEPLSAPPSAPAQPPSAGKPAAATAASLAGSLATADAAATATGAPLQRGEGFDSAQGALRAELPRGEAPSPSQATPEAFLHWLDQLRELRPPALAAEAGRGLAALEPGADLLVGATATATAVITPLMTESLAALNTEPAPPSSAAPGTVALVSAPLLASAASATAASTPATAPPLLAMDQGDWPQQLGEQIQWRLGVGIQEARIEVSPRELGAVEIRLSVDDDGLRVQLNAAQAQTRELLNAELPRLREALQQGGLQLADAQVGQDGANRQPPPSSELAAAPCLESSDEPDAGAMPATVWRVRRGLLDDYA